MYFRFLFCLLACFWSLTAIAEEKRIAVLEFKGLGLDQAVLLKLSDQTRAAAVEILPKDDYIIMTRETMLQVLSDMGKDATCLDGSCELEVGRNIAADFIVTGDILQIDSIYVLTLKLFDTKTGALIKTEEIENESILTLKHKTYAQSIFLFEKSLGIKTSPFDALKEITKEEVVSEAKKLEKKISIPAEIKSITTHKKLKKINRRMVGLKRGCDSGERDACLELGWEYAKGENISQQFSEAEAVLLPFCNDDLETPDLEVCYALGWVYEHQEKKLQADNLGGINDGKVEAISKNEEAMKEWQNILQLKEQLKSSEYTDSSSDDELKEDLREVQALFAEIKERCDTFKDSYEATAATATIAHGYCITSSQLDLVSFYRAYPLDSMAPESQEIFIDELEAQLAPIEEVAKTGIDELSAFIAEKQVWNQWTVLFFEENLENGYIRELQEEYRAACFEGEIQDFDSCLFVTSFENKDGPEARRFRCSDEDSLDCGVYYLKSLSLKQQLKEDYEKAAYLYEKSCKGGIQDACFDYALMFHKGKIGGIKAGAQTEMFFQQLCDIEKQEAPNQAGRSFQCQMTGAFEQLYQKEN